MKRTLRIFSLILLFCSILIGTEFTRQEQTAAYAASAPAVNVMIDGKLLRFDEASGIPYVENGRTMVPVRLPMETFGCTVEWNGELRAAVISRGNKTVTVAIDSDVMTVVTKGTDPDGEPVIAEEAVTLDAPAVIRSGRTYLPIRAIFEAFDGYVAWLNGTNTVDVFTTYTEGISREEIDYTLNGFVYLDEDGKKYTYRPISRKWDYHGTEWMYALPYSDLMYCTYTALDHGVTDVRSYLRFTKRLPGDNTIPNFVGTFLNAESVAGFSEREKVELMLTYIQSLEYVDDSTWTYGTKKEYPKFVYETLYDGCGDCEDFALLTAAILREMGYGCCLVLFPEHMGVGIACENDQPGAYYEYNGTRYYYIETTASGWEIGQMPEEYANQKADILIME